MTAARDRRPHPRDARSPGPWTIRTAAATDLPDLASLERACFTPPWSEALLRLELDAPGSLVLVAEAEGSAPGEPPALDRPPGLHGYAVFRAVADEAELLRVAVHPAGRRAGLGRGLVEAGLEASLRRGATRCFLEVRRDNHAAIALYRALGFDESGVRPGYYPDGADALLMARSLPRSPVERPE